MALRCGVRILAWTRDFSLFQNSSAWLWGPPSPLLIWYRLSFLPGGVKRPGSKVDHSPRSGAEVTNEWSCTSSPPICLCTFDRNNFAFYCGDYSNCWLRECDAVYFGWKTPTMWWDILHRLYRRVSNTLPATLFYVALLPVLFQLYNVTRLDECNRMDLQEVGLGYEDWIGLAQDRDRWRALVSAVRNLRVP